MQREFGDNLLQVRDIFALFHKHPNFLMAIESFASAIEAYQYKPERVGFYLYHSIECLRECYFGKDEKEKWEEMHKNLCTDKKTIKKFVKRHADGYRHGNMLSRQYWENWKKDINHAFHYVRNALCSFQNKKCTG